MEDYQQIIAGNIASLRKASRLTQAELAEKLNYSDKAVSKWERAEAIPDALILKQIADMFGVTLDYLFSVHSEEDGAEKALRRKGSNRLIIALLSVLTVWFIATVLFVIFALDSSFASVAWLAFVYGVPASLIVLLVFNSMWGREKNNLFIISALIWAILATVYLTLLKYNFWLIFFVGIPAQLAVLLWFGLDKYRHS